MAEHRVTDHAWNPWKLATIGIVVVLATALVTGIVVANYAGSQDPNPVAMESRAPSQQDGWQASASNADGRIAAAPPQNQAPALPVERRAPAQHATRHPGAADIEACNRYAASAGRDKTTQTLTDALIGGAVGAGVGAAGGAIAGGGKGAGKGAGIGGLVGATAGTLYGLDQGSQQDARIAAAYRACMKRHGYTD
jgi:hypothetical protein